MSDLISRSKLIDYFYFGIDDKPIIDGISDRKIINIIKNQPTAYDIDNIVQELEEMIHPKQLYFCKYARGGCKHLDNDDKDCMECVVENAIEIVKEGGENDGEINKYRFKRRNMDYRQ